MMLSLPTFAPLVPLPSRGALNLEFLICGKWAIFLSATFGILRDSRSVRAQTEVSRSNRTVLVVKWDFIGKQSHRCVLLLRHPSLSVYVVIFHEHRGLPALLRVGCLSCLPLYIVPSTLMLELIERLLVEGCTEAHEH